MVTVENSLMAFIFQVDLCRQGEEIYLKTEYRHDFDPQVYILKRESDKKAFRLRIQTDRSSAVKTEHHVCSILRNNGVSDFYPKPIGYYTGVPGIGDIAVSEYIDGKSIDKIFDLLSDDDCQAISAQVASILKEMHAIRDVSFHCFTGERFPIWVKFFESKFFNHVIKSIQYGNLLADVEQVRTKFLSDAYLFENKPCTLLHFDVKPSNIIYQKDSRRAFLIDFEMSRFGDIVFEFAKGSFAADISPFDRYETCLWKLIVEAYTKQSYNELKNSKLFTWYLLYHHLAHSNYMRLKDASNETTRKKRVNELWQLIMAG